MVVQWEVSGQMVLHYVARSFLPIALLLAFYVCYYCHQPCLLFAPNVTVPLFIITVTL